MKNERKMTTLYPLWLWLLTLSMGTLTWVLWSAVLLGDQAGQSLLSFGLVIFIYGAIFSLPALLIVWILYLLFVHFFKNYLLVHFLMWLSTMISIFLTFVNLGGMNEVSASFMIGVSVATLILSLKAMFARVK